MIPSGLLPLGEGDMESWLRIVVLWVRGYSSWDGSAGGRRRVPLPDSGYRCEHSGEMT